MVYWIHNIRLEQQFVFSPVFVDSNFNNPTFGILIIHDWLQILRELEVYNNVILKICCKFLTLFIMFILWNLKYNLIYIVLTVIWEEKETNLPWSRIYILQITLWKQSFGDEKLQFRYVSYLEFSEGGLRNYRLLRGLKAHQWNKVKEASSPTMVK